MTGNQDLNREGEAAASQAVTSWNPLHVVARTLRSSGVLRRIALAERRARSKLCDRWLGIQTIGEFRQGYDPAATRFRDPVGYEPMDYLLLRKYMRPVRLTRDDVVFDIGCGMGRTLCLFARRPVRSCVGIEYVPELAEAAQRNAARLRARRADVEIRLGDASEADYSGGTVYWMFNAFGEATLARVLQRIESSMRQLPRPIQLIYVNPKHQAVLDSCGWLRCTGIVRSVLYRTYYASYWENGAGSAVTGASGAP